MSKRQRRDHSPEPMTEVAGYPDRCRHCGGRVERVVTVGYDRSKPVSQRRTERAYWRHRRRWYRRPPGR